jgi:hypothetical protein
MHTVRYAHSPSLFTPVSGILTEEGKMLCHTLQFRRPERAFYHAKFHNAKFHNADLRIVVFVVLFMVIFLVGWPTAVGAQVKFDGIDDDGCLDFSWTEPSNADSVVSHYHVYVSTDGEAFQQTDTTLTNTCSVAGDSGHTYRVKVAGVNHSGDEGEHSPESDEILCLAPQPDLIPPKSISQLTAQESAGNLLLSWPPVTEDSLGGPEQISHYIVYRGQEPFFEPQSSDSVAGVTIPSYVDTHSGIGCSGLNHFYVITAVDMSGNESGISNTAGEYDYGIVPHSAGYFLVSPVLDDGLMSTASDLGQSIPHCTAVKEWDPETQSYVSRAFKISDTWHGEAPVTLGYPYYVFIEASPESSWTVVGTIPADPVFTLHAPGGNGYNTITLPLSSSLSLAKELGQSIPHCTAVKRWDAHSQGYESIAFKVGDTWYGDTPLQPGMPYYVNVTADGIWPGGKAIFSFDDRLRPTNHK